MYPPPYDPYQNAPQAAPNYNQYPQQPIQQQVYQPPPFIPLNQEQNYQQQSNMYQQPPQFPNQYPPQVAQYPTQYQQPGQPGQYQQPVPYPQQPASIIQNQVIQQTQGQAYHGSMLHIEPVVKSQVVTTITTNQGVFDKNAPIPGQIYQIECRLTPGKNFDIKKDSKAPGADVINFNSHGGANQRYLIRQGKIGVQLVPQSSNFPLVLNEDGIVEQQATSAPNSFWNIISASESDGYYYIKSVEGNIVMGLDNACPKDWTRIVGQEPGTGYHQQFRFIK